MIPLPARSIIRFRLSVLVFWVVVGVFALPRALGVNEVVQVAGGVLSQSESERATRLIQEAFQQPVSHFFVITVSAPEPIDSPRTRSFLESISTAASSESYIN